MSANINLSNGTCYTAAGKKLDSSFIPCGNEAFGYQTCCGRGDNCLADLACFGVHGSGYGNFLTYFAGCTDPNYKDGSCPKKEVDQPWVALTLCDNSDGAWAICSQSGNPSTLQPGSFCSCTNSASATVAFKDATSLANFASLPQSTGQSISFYAGHSPTGNPTPVPTGGSGSNGATTTAGSRAGGSSSSAILSTLPGGSVTTVYISVPTGSGGSNKKLGAGPIAGIAIGGLIAVLLLIILAILLMRRKRQHHGDHVEEVSAGSPSSAGGKLSKKRDSEMSSPPSVLKRPVTPSMPEADSVPVAEVAGQPADPWTMRSELDSKQVVPRRQVGAGRVSGESAQVQNNGLPALAELPGVEPQRRHDSHSPPVEEAMVAPLMLHSRNESGAQVSPVTPAPPRES